MTASTKRKVVAGCLMAVGVLVALFYFAVDPEYSCLMPRCAFKMLTGYDCPGCGSQRMIHALLHGELSEAWGYNPFLICMIPVMLIYFFLELFPGRCPRLFRLFYSPPVIYAIASAILAWGILRNL